MRGAAGGESMVVKEALMRRLMLLAVAVLVVGVAVAAAGSAGRGEAQASSPALPSGEIVFTR